MKRTTIVLLCFFVAPMCSAQPASAPVGGDGPNNAVSSSGGNSAAQPVAGANSFTQDQARSHILAKGYTDVSGLTKGSDGVWRGKGMKNGATHDVALDYQGNVFGH